jgi:hypothetical protein
VSRSGVLESLDFTRNGLDYTIEVRAGTDYRGTYNGGSDLPEVPLVANTIINRTQDETWTYSFYYGDASTSPVGFTDATGQLADWGSICHDDPTYYAKHQPGNAAVAAVTRLSPEPCSLDTDYVLYTEVLDVSDTGELIHTVTLTVPAGAEGLQDTGFLVGLDTMLNSDDDIPLTRASAGSLYMENGDFRLYVSALSSDVFKAGNWTRIPNFDTFVDVADRADGEVITTGVDSHVWRGISPRDIAPGTSVTFALAEGLYQPSEITEQTIRVTWVDDAAGGAAVTPVSGTQTVLTGESGTTVGFTEAMAQAGIPEGYTFVSVDNIGTFDFINDVDQIIVVHLTGPATPRGAEVVNVVYVDADDANAPVTPTAGATTVVRGEPGAAVTYTQAMAEAGVPEGYEFASMTTVDTFDDDPVVDQTITVSLTHAHVVTQVNSTRTITYAGAGAATPATVTQTVAWQVDTDQVTELATYTPQGAYPAVASPTVSGFTADLASVAALTPTGQPDDLAVTVTYTPAEPVDPKPEDPVDPKPQGPAEISTGGTLAPGTMAPLATLLLMVAGACCAAVAWRRRA